MLVFPSRFARAALGLMPALAVDRVVALVSRSLQRRHPRLFVNLGRLEPATVHLIPEGAGHAFGLRVGGGAPRFYGLEEGADEIPNARVVGPVEAFVAMLDGRADGDALFFSRAIQVTGDSSVIVGLRNTLDREDIDMAATFLSLLGPFKTPAARALGLAQALARGRG